MKKMNKKGFTIVELVIVIAVIAILAAVMIPTFTDVVARANESKALQQARNKYTELYSNDLNDGQLNGIMESGASTVTVGSGYSYGNGTVKYEYTDMPGYKATYDGGTWKVTETP